MAHSKQPLIGGPFALKTFRCGNSDAVRLPQAITFGPQCEVLVARNGDEITIKRVQKRPVSPQLLELIAQEPNFPRDVSDPPSPIPKPATWWDGED
jgi:virulence-associated protein VagC